MLYISTKFCGIYLKRYQSYRADSISILKITKGNNSAKNVGGVNVFPLCTSSGHALYLCHISYNYLEWYQSYRADTISSLKITKGNNSAKNVGGVTVLISARRLVMLYISTKFCEIISNARGRRERRNRFRPADVAFFSSESDKNVALIFRKYGVSIYISIYTRVISWCLTSGEVQHAIRLVFIKKSICARGPVWEGS